jgi:uncharacterized RDD family membrane protein YckC
LARWRDIKNQNPSRDSSVNNLNYKTTFKNTPFILRVKSFIVDMFMIMMPIMYITTYFILDGKDEFQTSQIARTLTAFIFGIVIVLFWYLKAQTPGMRAYDLKVVDKNSNGKISIIQAVNRYFFFLLSAMTIFGVFVPFFRKDRQTLHDIVSSTIVIVDETNNDKN